MQCSYPLLISIHKDISFFFETCSLRSKHANGNINIVYLLGYLGLSTRTNGGKKKLLATLLFIEAGSVPLKMRKYKIDSNNIAYSDPP